MLQKMTTNIGCFGERCIQWKKLVIFVCVCVCLCTYMPAPELEHLCRQVYVCVSLYMHAAELEHV